MTKRGSTYRSERPTIRKETQRVRVILHIQRSQHREVRPRIYDPRAHLSKARESQGLGQRRVRVHPRHHAHGDHDEDPAEEELRAVRLGDFDGGAGEDERGGEDEREREAEDAGAEG